EPACGTRCRLLTRISTSAPGAGVPAAGFGATGSTEVFRGRLRQALNGDWVFNASTGQNGVVGFLLGGVGNWSSSESPATGLQITMTFLVLQPVGPVLNEVIVLTTVILSEFTE